MTETVGLIRTSQRAGNGASPVSVEYFRRSLRTAAPKAYGRYGQHERVRADADPALEDTICELNCFTTESDSVYTGEGSSSML